MRNQFLLALCLSASVTMVYAQKHGALTIFSEDGDKFFLVLNGEKQNNSGQVNIRIEELPQPYYNAKIIFQDSSIMPISKNNLLIADADGVMKDVTYRIRRDKAGKAKLNYYSMIDVEPDFVPPSNVYVHRYGHPPREHVSVTTTTTTSTNPVSASVSVNGLNMQVNINDPGYSETVTTTSTTSHSNSNNGYNSTSRRGCTGSTGMRSTDFSAALKTIADASFDESKLSTSKSIVSSNCLTSAQVVQVCEVFGFEETKLAFAKYAYKYVTDPSNYFKVNNVFSFSSSKDELNDYIMNN